MDEYDSHGVDASAGGPRGGDVEYTLLERFLRGRRWECDARGAVAELSRRRRRVRCPSLADGAAGYDRHG